MCMHACMHARTHTHRHTHTHTHSLTHTIHWLTHSTFKIATRQKAYIYIEMWVQKKLVPDARVSIPLQLAASPRSLAVSCPDSATCPQIVKICRSFKFNFFSGFGGPFFFRLQFLARNTLSVRTRCSRAIFSRQNRQIHQKKKWERKRIHTQPRNGPHCCVETSTLIIFVFFENFRNLSRQICAPFKML